MIKDLRFWLLIIYQRKSMNISFLSEKSLQIPMTFSMGRGSKTERGSQK